MAEVEVQTQTHDPDEQNITRTVGDDYGDQEAFMSAFKKDDAGHGKPQPTTQTDQSDQSKIEETAEEETKEVAETEAKSEEQPEEKVETELEAETESKDEDDSEDTMLRKLHSHAGAQKREMYELKTKQDTLNTKLDAILETIKNQAAPAQAETEVEEEPKIEFPEINESTIDEFKEGDPDLHNILKTLTSYTKSLEKKVGLLERDLKKPASEKQESSKTLDELETMKEQMYFLQQEQQIVSKYPDWRNMASQPKFIKWIDSPKADISLEKRNSNEAKDVIEILDQWNEFEKPLDKPVRNVAKGKVSEAKEEILESNLPPTGKPPTSQMTKEDQKTLAEIEQEAFSSVFKKKKLRH